MEVAEEEAGGTGTGGGTGGGALLVGTGGGVDGTEGGALLGTTGGRDTGRDGVLELPKLLSRPEVPPALLVDRPKPPPELGIGGGAAGIKGAPADFDSSCSLKKCPFIASLLLTVTLGTPSSLVRKFSKVCNMKVIRLVANWNWLRLRALLVRMGVMAGSTLEASRSAPIAGRTAL